MTSLGPRGRTGPKGQTRLKGPVLRRGPVRRKERERLWGLAERRALAVAAGRCCSSPCCSCRCWEGAGTGGAGTGGAGTGGAGTGGDKTGTAEVEAAGFAELAGPGGTAARAGVGRRVGPDDRDRAEAMGRQPRARSRWRGCRRCACRRRRRNHRSPSRARWDIPPSPPLFPRSLFLHPDRLGRPGVQGHLVGVLDLLLQSDRAGFHIDHVYHFGQQLGSVLVA